MSIRAHAGSREVPGSLDLTRIFVEALADWRARSDQRESWRHLLMKQDPTHRLRSDR